MEGRTSHLRITLFRNIGRKDSWYYDRHRDFSSKARGTDAEISERQKDELEVDCVAMRECSVTISVPFDHFGAIRLRVCQNTA